MKKKSIVFALAAAACFSLGFASACQDKGSEKPSAFITGYATRVEMLEPLMIGDLIDVGGAQYTLIATNGEERVDLTGRSTWSPDASGEWTLTVEVKSGKYKGTHTATINVIVPPSSWSHVSGSLSYDYGSTITFEDLLYDLEIDVMTPNGYTEHIYSVRVGDVIIDFTEEDTSYTFVDFEPHYLTYGIVTAEGENYKAMVRINVVEEDPAALLYCEQNGIKAHDYQQLLYRDGALSAKMAIGSYVTSQFKYTNIPYVAFEGNYGPDSYLSVDFTGKNIPHTAFFCDEITNSIFDQNQGLYISHGTVMNDLTERITGDWSCLTFFGPQKMRDKRVHAGGSFGREGWISDPSPASRVGLQDGVRYRYIVGYSNAIAGTAGSTTDYGQITVHMLLINLDTNELVYDLEKVCKGSSDTGVLLDEHFDGSIVLYANFGYTTAWDNIRLIQQGVQSIYDLDPTVDFKADCPQYAVAGESVEPTDYFEADELANGQLYYAYNGGETQPFNQTLALNASGEYRITLVPNDTSLRPNSKVLYVNDDLNLDFEDGVTHAFRGYYRAGAYLETENVINGQKSLRMTVGNVLPLQTSMFGIDYAYLDRVFADPTVENVVLAMRSGLTVLLEQQDGWDSNGKRKMAAGGTTLEEGKLTFVTVTRSQYENSATNKGAYGMYVFGISGGSVTGYPKFDIIVDDAGAGIAKEAPTFVYQEGISLSYTFNANVEEFYYAGTKYANGQDGVEIAGKTVTVPAALVADKLGKTVQLAAKTAAGVEVVEQKIIERFNTYIISGVAHTSESQISLSIAGSVQTAKIDGADIAFRQVDGQFIIAKKDLIPYAGEEKILVVTTEDGALNIPVTATLCELNQYEEGETLFNNFKMENVGEGAVVDSSVITPYEGESSYRIELPDLPEGGYHTITIPFEYIDEAFSQPFVNAMTMYLALSYDGEYTVDGTKNTVKIGCDRASGLSVSPSYGVYSFKEGTANKFRKDDGSYMCRIAIDYPLYQALKLNEQDYHIYVDSRSHVGRTEYLYIDHVTISGTWSAKPNNLDVTAEALENGTAISGLYGTPTKVLYSNSNVDVTEQCTVNGNSLCVGADVIAKLTNTSYTKIEVTTDEGVSYRLYVKLV